MSRIAISMSCKRVEATAEIRHVVSASLSARHIAHIEAGTRRGPAGRDGEDGEDGQPGPPGGIDDNTILDGGNF